MHQMEIDRRTLVGGLLTACALPASESAARRYADNIIASGIQAPDGSYAAVIYDVHHGLLHRVTLPGRGHDLAFHAPTGTIVAFARRPGNFAIAFNKDARIRPTLFTTPPGRHFYGHGVFSADGRVLFTTENAFEDGAGVIGVWDVGGRFKRIGEFASHGTGPHDINLLSDGRTLVVANGGIATHPASGRKPLNLATMAPSLTYIDASTWHLIEQHRLPKALHKLSIRHLEVARGDIVVFGCQFKGPKTKIVDLIGFHSRGSNVTLMPSGTNVSRALRHYVSSIAVDRTGEIAAFTSSRGQASVFVDVRQRQVIGIRRLPDVSGVAPSRDAGAFTLTSGNGEVLRANAVANSADRLTTLSWHWDNHAIALFQSD